MPVKSLLSKNDKEYLNAALEAELSASHFYRHLANQCQRLGYFGAQKFFQAEAASELEHYQRIADFMNDRGDVAMIPAIDAQDEPVGSLRDALEAAYDTELQLSQEYESWFKRATSPITQQFLLQYLEIHRTSVGEYGDWVSRLDRVGDDKCGILLIDQEMGE